MRAVVALVKAPLFSVRVPVAFQSSISYPLPPPPTLVGALARAYAVTYGHASNSWGDKYIKECVEIVLRDLKWATVKPLSPIVLSSFLLNRLRVLEDPQRVIEKVSRGERISDIMVREYYSGEYSLIYVFSTGTAAQRAAKALRVLDRIGDTESLVSVEDVLEAEVRELNGKEGLVDTYFPLECAEPDELRGRFLLRDMHPLEFVRKVVRSLEDLAELRTYVIPLFEIRRGLLQPEEVRVTVREGCTILAIEAGNFEATMVVKL